MDDATAFLGSLAQGDPAALAAVLVFLTAATLTVAVGALVGTRRAVRRRVAAISRDAAVRDAPKRLPVDAGRQAAERLGAYASRHFGSLDSASQALLRTRLIQAGYLSPQALGCYLATRLAALILTGIGAYLALPYVMPDIALGNRWLMIGAVATIGYFLPQLYLDRRIKRRQDEHRTAFPDFMDLMVVCSDAGLSMEAALDRVGRELADAYPSLSANIHLAILELRAGRPLGEALERLGDRLAIDEARSFATLLQQSEELGTSLTETLRVYSDDMRHQRLARAEENAYSLPAKLSIPLTLCIFPVVMVVTMLPVVIRVRGTGF